MTIKKTLEPRSIIKVTEIFTWPCFSPGQARQHVREIAAENITDVNVIQILGHFAVRVSLDPDGLPDDQFSRTSTCDGNVYSSSIEVSTLIVVRENKEEAISIQNVIGE